MSDAEKAFKEALTIRWALVKQDPDVYQEQVSTTLHDWAKMYADNKSNKSVPQESRLSDGRKTNFAYGLVWSAGDIRFRFSFATAAIAPAGKAG